MFTALSVVKAVVSGVVGIGAGKIVKSIITNNVNTPEKVVDKVTTIAGAWAIAGLVANASKVYTDTAIDDTYNAVAKIVDGLKLSAKLTRISRDESTFEKEGLDPKDFVKEADGQWHKVKTEDPIDPKDSTVLTIINNGSNTPTAG